MKFIIMASVCLVAISQTLIADNNTNNSTLSVAENTVITETFTVSDMGCATDRKMVETALFKLKGVKKVVVANGEVTVTYDSSKVKREDIVKTIENTGTCEDPNAKVHKVKLKTA
jgi:copper chaperone CopZ